MLPLHFGTNCEIKLNHAHKQANMLTHQWLQIGQRPHGAPATPATVHSEVLRS